LAAYLPALPPGPVRERVLAGLAAGEVFGVADTEPTGAANASRETVAVPVDGGYRLTGRKTYIGNARIAGLLAVTATARDGADEPVELFVVDSVSPGFRVLARHDFIGLAGAPSAELALDGVYVPAELRLVTAEGGWRAAPAISDINALARMYITAAPALGVARRCLNWSRDFVRRRRVDNRSLGDYAAIQRLLADSLADLFALESVVRYALICPALADRWWERTVAKNVGTTLGWRVVDRTMSLFGAEGLETAASKARRGVPPVPLERALRDVRALRIAGGVDFHIDLRAGWRGLFGWRYAESAPAAPAPFPSDIRLSPANLAHLRFGHDETARLDRFCAELTGWCRAEVLRERQPLLIAANRLAVELFTMSVTLARAAGDSGVQGLADVYCAGARSRVAALWRELESPPDAPYAEVSGSWLALG
jgi:alkylation response protein AidB-like acyl-CoA dehydrogenase